MSGSDFEYVSSRLGNVKPETRAFAEEIFYAAQAAGHEIWFMWGMGESVEHASGLALDLMVHNEAAGDFVRDYTWANRARIGLRHVIWEQHITSTVTQPGVRREMADRGNPTANHYDHAHTWQIAGIYKPPSGGAVIPPSGALDVDGRLGSKTITRWQQVMGTPVDGVISTPYSNLVYAVQKKLRATVEPSLVLDGNGIFQNNKWYHTAKALQEYLGTSQDGAISAPVSAVIKALQRRLNEGRF